MQTYIFTKIIKNLEPGWKIVLSIKRYITSTILWIFYVFQLIK